MAVEYALGAALILVVSLGAIDALRTSARDELAGHGASAGAPDLPDTGIPVTTSTTSPSPTTAPPTTAPSSVAATTTIVSSAPNPGNGNQWSPQIAVSVTGPSGEVLTGAILEVTWTGAGLQNSPIVETCPVVASGVCSFQLSQLNSNQVSSVTATVTAVTGSNPTITYAPGGTTVTLTRS